MMIAMVISGAILAAWGFVSLLRRIQSVRSFNRHLDTLINAKDAQQAYDE